MTSWDLDMGGD